MKAYLPSPDPSRPSPQKSTGTARTAPVGGRSASQAAPVSHAAPSTRDLLSRTAEEAAQALPVSLQNVLSDRVVADFSSVRVYAGAASAAAAERLGARAYTLGHRIHLGTEATTLAAPERDRLLTHEAVHAAQQGLRPVRPHDSLRVGRPDSAAEAEARLIAASVSTPTASASLAVRDRLRGAMPVQQQVEPQIQRDLKGPYKGIDGTFNLDLKTEAHAGATNGMSGTIKFKASDGAGLNQHSLATDRKARGLQHRQGFQVDRRRGQPHEDHDGD